MKVITTEEFDKKFDDGRDISKYLDTDKIMKLNELEKIKNSKRIDKVIKRSKTKKK